MSNKQIKNPKESEIEELKNIAAKLESQLELKLAEITNDLIIKVINKAKKSKKDLSN